MTRGVARLRARPRRAVREPQRQARAAGPERALAARSASFAGRRVTPGIAPWDSVSVGRVMLHLALLCGGVVALIVRGRPRPESPPAVAPVISPKRTQMPYALAIALGTAWAIAAHHLPTLALI